MQSGGQPNVVRYKLFGKTVFKVIDTGWCKCVVVLHVLKIFFGWKYRRVSVRSFKQNIGSGGRSLLYFDHCWGGGVAVYSDGKIDELSKKFDVVICKYNPDCGAYFFSRVRDGAVCVVKKFRFRSWHGLFSRIVINNLVGYKSIMDVIGFVTREKNASPGLGVEFMLHDYYCLCPTVHLLQPNLVSCVKHDAVVCTKCQSNILQWRAQWLPVLENVVTDIVVFSDSSKKIFLSVYPSLESKVRLVPHNVPKMRSVKIKKHNGINIGVVGNLTSVKGKEIVCQMLDVLPDDVRIVNIGTFYGDMPQSEKFVCTGPYVHAALPDLVQMHQIDVVFIASVVPETFSFTTSECIDMGLPVVCFDIGAPAQRVAKYESGMVISQIDANVALTEILNFVHQIKRTPHTC